METVKGPDSPEKKLERMVELYQLPLLRLCYAYLHDEELAKDAVQETFIKAYRNLDQFDRRSSEKTWLNRIAINTCKDVCRSGWFRHVDRRITPDMLPETEIRPEEKDENLTVAILELPVKLRETVLLYYYQNMKIEEIADILGIAVSSASERLKRAKEKLRYALKEVYFNE